VGVVLGGLGDRALGLAERELRGVGGLGERATERADEEPPRHEFGCTGSPSQFQSVAERFLGPEIVEVRASVVELVGG